MQPGPLRRAYLHASACVRGKHGERSDLPITYGSARHQHSLSIVGLGSVLLLWHITSGFAQQQEPVIQLPSTSVTAPAPLPESLPRSWIPSRVESLSRPIVPAGQPTGLPEARYVGSQFLRGDEINTERPLPAYWSATLGTSARLWGGEAFVQINNVFNNAYETFGTFAINGRQTGNPVERFLTPAPPISVLAGVQYRF